MKTYFATAFVILISHQFLCAQSEPSPDSTKKFCKALFDYSGSKTIKNQIEFTNYSTGYANLWTWEFGDGTFSHKVNPIHQYDKIGSYEVCLSISNNGYPGAVIDSILLHCKDKFCTTIIVPEIPDSGSHCKALYTFTQTEKNYFNFQALSHRTIPEGFKWNFGDGTSGTGENISHRYNKPGKYFVCLTTSKWIYPPQPDSGTSIYNIVEICSDEHCTILEIKDSDVTSVDESIITGKYPIYPNPVIDVVTIVGNVKSIMVQNILGETILLKANESTFNVSGLAPGIYQLVITYMSNEKVIYKMFKN